MIGLLDKLVGPVTGILDKVITDKDQAAKLAHEIATMAERHSHEASMAQANANVEQAKHSSLFVAGARPAIMWICALGLMTNFFIMPLAEWATAVWFPGTPLPNLDTGELMTLTLSLLGLGGMRSWEKSKGIARNNLKG